MKLIKITILILSVLFINIYGIVLSLSIIWFFWATLFVYISVKLKFVCLLCKPLAMLVLIMKTKHYQFFFICKLVVPSILSFVLSITIFCGNTWIYPLFFDAVVAAVLQIFLHFQSETTWQLNKWSTLQRQAETSTTSLMVFNYKL